MAVPAAEAAVRRDAEERVAAAVAAAEAALRRDAEQRVAAATSEATEQAATMQAEMAELVKQKAGLQSQQERLVLEQRERAEAASAQTREARAGAATVEEDVPPQRRPFGLLAEKNSSTRPMTVQSKRWPALSGPAAAAADGPPEPRAKPPHPTPPPSPARDIPLPLAALAATTATPATALRSSLRTASLILN